MRDPFQIIIVLSLVAALGLAVVQVVSLARGWLMRWRVRREIARLLRKDGRR